MKGTLSCDTHMGGRATRILIVANPFLQNCRLFLVSSLCIDLKERAHAFAALETVWVIHIDCEAQA